MQATVSDQRYEAVVTGREQLDYRAVYPAVYDYYPFGMPIKERTIRDTNVHTTYAVEQASTPVTLTVNNAFNTGVTAFLHSTIQTGGFLGGISAVGQDGGMQKVLTGLTPGALVTVNLHISAMAGTIIIAANNWNGAAGAALGAALPVNGPGPYTYMFTPTSSSALLSLGGIVSYLNPQTDIVTVSSVSYTQPNGVVSSPQLVQLSSVGKDRYEFGFNGQEKVNEIAGMGNWNTAEFWEYNTRTGVRANPDPVKIPSISAYAAFGLNPILNSDVLGNTFTTSTDKQAVEDVKSLPTDPDNIQYIDICENGTVTTNFRDLSEKKVNKLLDRDKGLKLIYDLEHAKDKSNKDLKFYYSVSLDGMTVGADNQKIDLSPYKMGSGDDAFQYYWGNVDPWRFNASKTQYGTDLSGKPQATFNPKPGYDGQVAIWPGVPYYQLNVDKGETYTINGVTRHNPQWEKVWMPVRPQTLRHELQENLIRTQENLPYKPAHEKTEQRFPSQWDNGQEQKVPISKFIFK